MKGDKERETDGKRNNRSILIQIDEGFGLSFVCIGIFEVVSYVREHLFHLMSFCSHFSGFSFQNLKSQTLMLFDI